MTYVLVGPSILTQEKEEELILKNHFEEEERFTYDLEEISLFALLESVNTISFLSPKKVVLLRNAFFLESEGPRKIEDEEIKAFLDYLSHQSEDVLLILSVKKLDERKKKLQKALKEQTTIFTLTYDLEEEIKKNLLGYQIEKDALDTLIEALKGEESRILMECEKLKIYKIEEKKITKEDVLALVRFALPDQEETVFNFARELASRDKKQAYKSYLLLKQMGVDSLSLMGLLENQFRTLYQVKVLSSKGLMKDQIAKKLNYHPFRVQKTQELLRFFSKGAIRDFLLLLQSLDYEMKSGKIDGEFLIDFLIMRV